MENKRTHWIYGIITSIVVMGVTIIMSVTHFDERPHTDHIPDLLFFIGILLNAIAYSKANHANVTYADVFRSCFIVSCFVAIGMWIWMGIYVHNHPELVSESIAQAKMELAKRHKPYSDADMAQPSRIVPYTVPFSMAIVKLIFGVVFSIICAAIAKKRPKVALN